MAIRLTGVPGRPVHEPHPGPHPVDGLRPLARRPRPRPRRPRQRALTLLSAQELTLNDQAIETFAEVVGGRQQLLTTLALGATDVLADKVVNALSDPRYATWSLRRICAEVGLTVVDLLARYKQACFTRAHIEATHRITESLVPVVVDVMARALPQDVPCPRCEGRPAPPDTTVCTRCHGVGTVVAPPDLQRQKLALELGHLIERHGGGVVVQQNAIAATVTQTTTVQAGSLEQLQQVVGDLLFSPGRRRAASPGGVLDTSSTDPIIANPTDTLDSAPEDPAS